MQTMGRRVQIATASVAMCLVALLAGQGQQSPLTFRAVTRTVDVDVIVTDAPVGFVRDLQVQDFEVLEDGRPQKIEVFSMVDLPAGRREPSASRERTPAVAEDVATNITPSGGLYVIVLDSLQVDAHRTPIVKDLARRFILEHLHPTDQVALVTIGSNASQEFTTSRAALLRSVDQFMGQKMDSPILLALRTGDAPMERDATRSRERAAQAIDSLRALRSLVTALGGVTGRRKAVVLFSEGLDFNTDFLIRQRASSQYPGEAVAEGTPGAVLDEQREMIGAATRANVPLYTVDPRGLASPAEELIKVGPILRSDTELLMKGMRFELEREQSRLREFSEQTGGLSTVNVNDFDAGFTSIIKDTSSYYLLGYQSPAKPDGNFHRITVRVKRPGVQVRARSGYYAPRSTPAVDSSSDPLPALLASPVTISGLPLRVTSHVLRGAAGDARVLMTVEVEGSGLPFEERAGVFANTVEISYLALDKSAKSRAGAKKTLALSLQPAAKQAIVTGGLRFVTEFTIPEGRYHMRLAARETFGAHAGSVSWDLDASDALRSSPAMSDIILTFSRAAAWPTRLDVAGLQDWLPGPPTAERSFAAQDTVAVFTEIYVGPDSASVDLEATVRSADGRELYAAREPLDRARLTADGRYRFVVTIPLKEFRAGRYVLTVTAAAKGESATRSLAFSVR